MNRAAPKWSKERIADLKRLWGNGWSASQVAKWLSGQYRLPVSRSAVIGQVHRLGIGRGLPSVPKRLKPTVRKTETRKPPKQIRPVFPPKPYAKSTVVADVSNAKPLLQHRLFEECAWVVSAEGEPPVMCCALTCSRGFGTLCEPHADQAFVAGTASDPKKAERSLRRWAA